MSLIVVCIVVAVVGVLLWLANTYLPMARPVKLILNAVVVIALVVWLLHVCGVWHYLARLRV